MNWELIPAWILLAGAVHFLAVAACHNWRADKAMPPASRWWWYR